MGQYGHVVAIQANDVVVEQSAAAGQVVAEEKLVHEDFGVADDLKFHHTCLYVLYLLLVLSLVIAEIIVQVNTPAYVFNVDKCNSSSIYLKNSLPLFPSVGARNVSFYTGDWHFLPNQGLCAADPTDNVMTPSFKYNAHARRLRASGGGGGGHGGSGRSSSSRSSSTSSSSSSSTVGSRRYRGYPSGGMPSAAYTDCVTWGKTKSGGSDTNSISVWEAVDKANADSAYNSALGYGVVKTDFSGAGAMGMQRVNSLLLAGTIVSCIGYPSTLLYLLTTQHAKRMDFALYLNVLVQAFTTWIAFTVIVYLPENEFINRDNVNAWTKVVFPTCTLSITDGPLFSLLLYIVIVNGILLTFFVLAEIHYHCCMGNHMVKREYAVANTVEGGRDLVAASAPPAGPKPHCSLGHTMKLIDFDPYVSIGQFAICDCCQSQKFFERDGKGFHCPICGHGGVDYCFPCGKAKGFKEEGEEEVESPTDEVREEAPAREQRASRLAHTLAKNQKRALKAATSFTGR